MWPSTAQLFCLLLLPLTVRYVDTEFAAICDILPSPLCPVVTAVTCHCPACRPPPSAPVCRRHRPSQSAAAIVRPSLPPPPSVPVCRRPPSVPVCRRHRPSQSAAARHRPSQSAAVHRPSQSPPVCRMPEPPRRHSACRYHLVSAGAAPLPPPSAAYSAHTVPTPICRQLPRGSRRPPPHSTHLPSPPAATARLPSPPPSNPACLPSPPPSTTARLPSPPPSAVARLRPMPPAVAFCRTDKTRCRPRQAERRRTRERARGGGPCDPGGDWLCQECVSGPSEGLPGHRGRPGRAAVRWSQSRSHSHQRHRRQFTVIITAGGVKLEKQRSNFHTTHVLSAANVVKCICFPMSILFSESPFTSLNNRVSGSITSASCVLNENA